MGQLWDKTSFGQVWDKFGTWDLFRYVWDFLRHVFDIIEQIWDKFSTCLGQVWEVVYDWLRVNSELNIKKPLTHGQQALKYDAFED